MGICLPGYGGPFEDHVAVVDRILERQERRGQPVMKLLREGKKMPYEVLRGLFPELPAQHLHLGLSSAVGRMYSDGRIGERRSDAHLNGVLEFQLY